MRGLLLCAVVAVAAAATASAASVPSADIQNDLGRSCAEDLPCEFSMKCENAKCVCGENYHLSRGKCLGGVGQYCQYSNHCILDAECSNSKCQCMNGFQASADGQKCVGEVPNRIPGSTCEFSSECDKFGLAFCKMEAGQCECNHDAHLRNNYCQGNRGWGDKCSDSDQCYSPESPRMECNSQNQTCSCQTGSVFDPQNKTCNSAVSVVSSVFALAAMFLTARLLSA